MKAYLKLLLAALAGNLLLSFLGAYMIFVAVQRRDKASTKPLKLELAHEREYAANLGLPLEKATAYISSITFLEKTLVLIDEDTDTAWWAGALVLSLSATSGAVTGLAVRQGRGSRAQPFESPSPTPSP
jgi:uncharacterized membrane protein YqhA